VNIVESTFANVFWKNECQAETGGHQWEVKCNYIRVCINTYLVAIQTEAVTCNVFNKFNVEYVKLLTRIFFALKFCFFKRKDI